jgi:hypothetical protein
VQENILLRRPPVSHTSSSQEGLSVLLSDPVMRGKTSSGASEGMDFSKSSGYPFLLGCDVVFSMIQI